MDRILIILKTNGPISCARGAKYHNIYWYMQQISGEHLQDHWSSGLYKTCVTTCIVNMYQLKGIGIVNMYQLKKTKPFYFLSKGRLLERKPHTKLGFDWPSAFKRCFIIMYMLSHGAGADNYSQKHISVNFIIFCMLSPLNNCIACNCTADKHLVFATQIVGFLFYL